MKYISFDEEIMYDFNMKKIDLVELEKTFSLILLNLLPIPSYFLLIH